MAHVTLPDGRELDVDDSDTGLLDYYRGEGAQISDEAQVLRPPYTIEDGHVVEPPLVAEPGEYDPSGHSVEEVVAWLDDPANTADRQRVLELEQAGKARVTILGWEPPADDGDESGTEF